MRVITLITQMMVITLMVLVLSGNADCGRSSLSLISRSLRASEVPAPGNHLLLSLHTTCYDRRAVYRMITLRCISSSIVISVITFNFAVSGDLALARPPYLAVLLFIVSIIAQRHCRARNSTDSGMSHARLPIAHSMLRCVVTLQRKCRVTTSNARDFPTLDHLAQQRARGVIVLLQCPGDLARTHTLLFVFCLLPQEGDNLLACSRAPHLLRAAK